MSLHRTLLAIILILTAGMIAFPATESYSSDYNPRFARNYPPGFYGMWYYAERFYDKKTEGEVPEELYRWDGYMSRVTNVYFPFKPIPFPWDYGTGRKFNLPNYRSNDWP